MTELLLRNTALFGTLVVTSVLGPTAHELASDRQAGFVAALLAPALLLTFFASGALLSRRSRRDELIPS